MKTANTSYKILSHFVTNDRWSEGHNILDFETKKSSYYNPGFVIVLYCWVLTYRKITLTSV